MKTIHRVVTLAVASALILVVVGCPAKEGPAERAGKAVDKAVDKAGQKLERAGDDLRDAAKGEKK